MANILSLKWNPEKSAILVIGAKFGGCGKNRLAANAKKIPNDIFK